MHVYIRKRGYITGTENKKDTFSIGFFIFDYLFSLNPEAEEFILKTVDKRNMYAVSRNRARIFIACKNSIEE